MNPTSTDMKDILEAESSLGLTFATNLFIGREPTSQDAQDNVVTIFDTPGAMPDLTQLNDSQAYGPAFQIRVRNTSYLAGWNLINDVKTTLHGRGPETWNTTRYMLIQCTIEPALLDYDDHGRSRFVTTFNVKRKP